MTKQVQYVIAAAPIIATSVVGTNPGSMGRSHASTLCIGKSMK